MLNYVSLKLNVPFNDSKCETSLSLLFFIFNSFTTNSCCYRWIHVLVTQRRRYALVSGFAKCLIGSEGVKLASYLQKKKCFVFTNWLIGAFDLIFNLQLYVQECFQNENWQSSSIFSKSLKQLRIRRHLMESHNLGWYSTISSNILQCSRDVHLQAPSTSVLKRIEKYLCQ